MLTQEQHEFRKTGLGGSDMASICAYYGLDIKAYKTGLQVWREKMGMPQELTKEQEAFFEERSLLEPAIVQMFRRKEKKRVRTNMKPMRHKDHPWMIANIDGYIAAENAVFEAKSAGIMTGWDEGSDEIPFSYMIQCAHYAAVYDCDKVYLAVLFGNWGFQYKLYTYHRDRELEAKIIKMGERFWNEHVKTGIEPKPQTMDDARTLFPSANDKTFAQATDDLINKVKRKAELDQQIKDAEAEIEKIKVEVSSALGTNTTLVDQAGNKLATWNVEKRSYFNKAGLKIDHPEISDLIDQYQQTSEGRVLRFKKIKEAS